MPTYYSQSGFTIEIVRASPFNFSGSYEYTNTVAVTETIIFDNTDNTLFLIGIGTYVFSFLNITENDPASFTLLDYDTSELIAEIDFPLADLLILITGADGQSDQNLLITYPLKAFTFSNPGVRTNWLCRLLELGQGGDIEIAVENLDDPKIIGNLSGCSNQAYKGNITEEITCESETLNEIYVFEIRNSLSNELLYSRVECCCPIVTPGDPPGFVCTCPDWGKATSYNQTLFSSSIRLREWVLSNAGSKADCKHIMAAKRIMNIEQPIYTDPPYSAPPPPSMPN